MSPDENELLAQAQAAPEGNPRSKLESYCAAIFELRRKHWTYQKIAHWLKERGVTIAPSSIFRFCRSRKGTPQSPVLELPLVKTESPVTSQVEPAKPKRKYRFNLDV
jgi:IS30 family transposase